MNDEMRAEFERIYFQAHQYRKTLAGITGYCNEYHEIWEGFQAAYQLQQERIEELEKMVDYADSKIKEVLQFFHDEREFRKTKILTGKKP